MSAEPEINVEALQAELAQIKDAMGIEERYPSQFRVWPIWGALVLAASLVSQYISLTGLPAYLYSVVWFGFVGIGGLYQWRTIDSRPSPNSEAKPDAWLQIGSVLSLLVVYAFGLGPALAELPGEKTSIILFSLIVALVGVAYLVLGNTLKSYYIRRRDRYAFYVGGAWMLGLATLLPNVAVLQRWGYAAYGVLFAVHSLASYAILSHSD